MTTALRVLKLSRIFLIHAGDHSSAMADRIQAIAARCLREDLPGMLR